MTRSRTARAQERRSRRRDGFDPNPVGVGANPAGFTTNPIGFAAAPCALRSFLCRFEPERSAFHTPTDVSGSFLYGIESFPRGNDLQQLLKNQWSIAVPDFPMWKRLVSTWKCPVPTWE